MLAVVYQDFLFTQGLTAGCNVHNVGVLGILCLVFISGALKSYHTDCLYECRIEKDV